MRLIGNSLEASKNKHIFLSIICNDARLTKMADYKRVAQLYVCECIFTCARAHLYTYTYIRETRRRQWEDKIAHHPSPSQRIAKKIEARAKRSRTDWCTYDWLVMQHKLNCIGRLHTPISPVSHGHRTALSGARVRACMRGWEAPRHALSALLYAAKIAIAWGLPVRNSHRCRWGRPPKIPPPIGPIPITRTRFLFFHPLLRPERRR